MNIQPTPEQIFGTFVSWKYDAHTWFITGLGGSLYMYLLEGDEKAILIDTAYGFCDMKAYCERLTDKPVLAANTHGHLDHAGGNGFFTEVYMHENAPVDYKTFEGGPCDISKLPHPDFKKINLKDGDTIDLGNRCIEVIDISSHSNGSLAFLDGSHRLLFCGDELESSQVLMYEIVENERNPYDLGVRIKKHKENMEKLWERRNEFDFCCPGHNGAPIAKEYIQDFMGLSKEILAGTVKIEDKLNHPHIEADPIGQYLCRTRYRQASFFVNKEQLLKLKKNRGIKAVIFDLDGVLVFTDKFHYQAWKKMADGMGIYFDEKINNRLRGVSRMASLEIILERYEGEPLSLQKKEELAEQKNEIYKELLKTMTPDDVSIEVRDTLAELKKRGYGIALGSSSKNAKFILQQVELLDAFDAISDGTNITHSKPDPEVFIKGAEFLKKNPSECLVVEDAEAGIDAGIAGGMKTAAIGDAVKCKKADYVLETFPDLLKILV